MRPGHTEYDNISHRRIPLNEQENVTVIRDERIRHDRWERMSREMMLIRCQKRWGRDQKILDSRNIGGYIEIDNIANSLKRRLLDEERDGRTG